MQNAAGCHCMKRVEEQGKMTHLLCERHFTSQVDKMIELSPRRGRQIRDRVETYILN